MTTVPKRLGVKFSLSREPNLQPAALVPIFQRWIQERTVPGMLIDVIDYKHVPDGPGVVLVADEADYAWDLGGGRVGLRYIRKRALPDNLTDALRLCFEHAEIAARQLQEEAPGDVLFDFSAAEIAFLDRLDYPNEDAVAESTQCALTGILADLLGADVTLSRLHDDARHPLTLRCQADSPLTWATVTA